LNIKKRITELGLDVSKVGKVGKQKRTRRQMRDTKTKVIYSGFGPHPRNFDMSRAVPL